MFILLKGIIVYLVMLFFVDGGVDLIVFDVLIECLVVDGVYVIVLLGSIGESVYLFDVEWEVVVIVLICVVCWCVLIVVGIFDFIMVGVVCCVCFVE